MRKSTIKRKKPVSSNLETRPIPCNLLLTLTGKKIAGPFPNFKRARLYAEASGLIYGQYYLKSLDTYHESTEVGK